MSDHEERALTKVLKALHAWLVTHTCCASRKDLQDMEEHLSTLIVNQQPTRYIRLHVAEVRFVQPEKKVNMPDNNIGIDVPAGKIARLVFDPYNEKLQPAKLDGPLIALVTSDSPTPAEVAVGGPSGLWVDIKPLDAEGSIANVEIKGDPDLDPAKREVLTTLVTVRRLGEVPGKAVSLGGNPEKFTFENADQFGVFPDPPALSKK
jgi:hypothetical protein